MGLPEARSPRRPGTQVCTSWPQAWVTRRRSWPTGRRSGPGPGRVGSARGATTGPSSPISATRPAGQLRHPPPGALDPPPRPAPVVRISRQDSSGGRAGLGAGRSARPRARPRQRRERPDDRRGWQGSTSGIRSRLVHRAFSVAGPRPPDVPAAERPQAPGACTRGLRHGAEVSPGQEQQDLACGSSGLPARSADVVDAAEADLDVRRERDRGEKLVDRATEGLLEDHPGTTTGCTPCRWVDRDPGPGSSGRWRAW